jgi:hypothetical protein
MMTDPNVSHVAGVSREESDVNFRAILGFGAGLIAVAAAVYFGVWLLFMFFAGREAARVSPQFPLAVGQENRLPPEPRLQTNPRQDLLDLRAAEETTLTTYGWVDKNAGIARIPIDEAMKRVVEKGLPARASGKKK